jgi:hypothetical protein
MEQITSEGTDRNFLHHSDPVQAIVYLIGEKMSRENYISFRKEGCYFAGFIIGAFQPFNRSVIYASALSDLRPAFLLLWVAFLAVYQL